MKEHKATFMKEEQLAKKAEVCSYIKGSLLKITNSFSHSKDSVVPWFSAIIK